MINVFISVPMRNRTKENIEYSIRKMKRIARAVLAENDIEANNINFINTILRDTPPAEVDERIWCLGGALQLLSKADYLVTPDGLDYHLYPGCTLEGQTFAAYKGVDKIIPVRFEYIFTEEEKAKNFGILPSPHTCTCETDKACTCEQIKPEDC